MGRILVALVTSSLALGPVGLEGRGAHPGGRPATAPGLAIATFSLARGVIAGAAVGHVDRSFLGTGSAVCFLPGTFDLSMDGTAAGGLQPSSNCGYDATVRIEAFAEVRAGEEAARPMTINWTDLAGRTYILRFSAAEHGEADDVRVVCLGATEAGCYSAVVDSSDAALVSEDGGAHDTGPRAQLSVVLGPGPSELRDLGVYDVPFTLTIDPQ